MLYSYFIVESHIRGVYTPWLEETDNCPHLGCWHHFDEGPQAVFWCFEDGQKPSSGCIWVEYIVTIIVTVINNDNI